MRIVDTYWDKEYPVSNQIIYSLLYSLSFATLFIWVKYPYDLLLLNILVQLIFIWSTKTTLHGYLSGNMKTVKHIN